MLFSMRSSAAIAALLAPGCVQAHMFLATPIRFEQDPLVTAGPLLADGRNYPCQAGPSGAYSVKQVNTYPLGSTQTIAFIGQAVHAGGSGQAALTYDTAPRPNSVFKVLKSFEGGFVAKNQIGNMGGDASAPDPYTYTFDVPKDIPAGNATVAITWFNKVGNREMYMMCAPVVVTGSGGDKANFDALTDMFKANIGNGCGTQASKDLVFPDPGKILERNNGATTSFATPTGTGCPTPVATRPAGSAGGSSSAGSASAGTGAPGGGGGAGAGYFVTSPTDSPTPSTSAISTTAATTSSSPTATTTTAPPPPPPPATTAIITAAPGNTSSATASSGPGGVLTGACASEGTFNCIDGTKYQQCGSGKWSVAMPVAPGTKCAVGSGPSLNVAPAKLRFRRVRFAG
ncbi:Lytic polysaccharide monooxygenase [Coniochaeta hoffmannii]|uniref:Lytic polysaccharide monooxygenase n=1 Tax=Coniochaeta hoffmannii TaxID=91930 RepID=A0AA38S7T2_9PEZI|nr:Lytic polysaccharide monooxygenase [Coniochaeta hoffmannii]